MQVLALPGDEIEIKSQENKQFVIGPGLRKDNQNSIVAMKCGFLKRKENFYWIDSFQKRVGNIFSLSNRHFLIYIILNLPKSTFQSEMNMLLESWR